MARSGGTWMQRWRVPLGFLCGIIFMATARPQWRSLAIGGIIALAGLGLRAWGSGHLRKNDVLAISGPYAYTRNPLYLGSFLMGVGFTVAAGRWYLGVLFAALFLGIYFPVMRVEAAHLTELFGESFARYAREVPLFLPRPMPYRMHDNSFAPTHFDRALYLRYREYRAALGVVAAWGILAAKTIWLS